MIKTYVAVTVTLLQMRKLAAINLMMSLLFSQHFTITKRLNWSYQINRLQGRVIKTHRSEAGNSLSGILQSFPADWQGIESSVEQNVDPRKAYLAKSWAAL